MRGFKWSSNQKRHLTAIAACPQQQSMTNKPWMIKKINWRALSDTGHLCQGGSYVTLTPCLLIVGDLPWNKVLCGRASIETITPMQESRVNISWCISFSDFQNRIQKKRISRKNVNRVFFLKKKRIIKTLSTNVRRINSERYFTGYGRVTPQPGVLPGGGNVGHLPQSLHSRKPGPRASQSQFKPSLLSRWYRKTSHLLDFSGSICFVCKQERNSVHQHPLSGFRDLKP